MKPIITLTFTLLLSYSLPAQVISQFVWNSNPVTTALVGPNAISVSGSAVSSAGGVGGTNGLNAGLPTADINLTIPTGGGIFDVAGIEVSFDYQREENTGNFFTRGSSLVIMGTTNLSVTYRVDNGAGGFNTVNSGNVFAIPNDNTFRNYRFFYLPTSGVGALTVNGATVWTNDGPDNRPMYWTGSGNIVIGALLDGAGANQTFLDNLIIGQVSSSPLPIELLDFTASLQNDDKVKLEWQTASEHNNDYFTPERSADALNWEELGRVKGSGNSSVRQSYFFHDEDPLRGLAYYRLKQTDFDGQYSYSSLTIVNSQIQRDFPIRIYPNPASSHITVESKGRVPDQIKLYNMLGQDISKYCQFIVQNENILLIDLSALQEGLYLIECGSGRQSILKQ